MKISKMGVIFLVVLVLAGISYIGYHEISENGDQSCGVAKSSFVKYVASRHIHIYGLKRAYASLDKQVGLCRVEIRARGKSNLILPVVGYVTRNGDRIILSDAVTRKGDTFTSPEEVIGFMENSVVLQSFKKYGQGTHDLTVYVDPAAPNASDLVDLIENHNSGLGSDYSWRIVPLAMGSNNSLILASVLRRIRKHDSFKADRVFLNYIHMAKKDTPHTVSQFVAWLQGEKTGLKWDGSIADPKQMKETAQWVSSFGVLSPIQLVVDGRLVNLQEVQQMVGWNGDAFNGLGLVKLIKRTVEPSLMGMDRGTS